jgi:aspartyl/asparaginyl-tRNA synthetase
VKDTIIYNDMVDKLRFFFKTKGYIEIPVQSRLSILAACEDPRTISTFVFDGKSWPLPQTGQMQLEYELLARPDLTGAYCISTSYRNEPQPIAGRHDKIFPMFEFESKGDMDDLVKLEQDLLIFLNIPFRADPCTYNSLLAHFSRSELSTEHEQLLFEEYGNIFITNFPESTDPFWNMKRDKDGTAKKVDVIINGIETIGSAERATDPDVMRDRFHSISNGEYAGLLFRHFGKERVEKELDEYLSFNMFPRFGGGIGLTRLARGM